MRRVVVYKLGKGGHAPTQPKSDHKNTKLTVYKSWLNSAYALCTRGHQSLCCGTFMQNAYAYIK